MQDKIILRQQATKSRASFPLSGYEAENAASVFFNHVMLTPGDSVAVYYPVGHELSPYPLTERLWQHGIRVLLPTITQKAGLLSFREWGKETPLERGPYGIPQPSAAAPAVDPAIILVPLLLFDRKGTRLGYGGGYYDRTLGHLRMRQPGILAIGYAYAAQISLFPLPVEPHDEKLDAVVTENSFFAFEDI